MSHLKPMMFPSNVFIRISSEDEYIVAYRPIDKRELCKQRPFLGNGSVNTFPRKQNSHNFTKGPHAIMLWYY
jgi:hypothetical protein